MRPIARRNWAHRLRCAVRPADISEARPPGKEEGTRELVLSPLPYIVVYAVHGDVIYVVRILHGAQEWP
jgi:plasmid stabilization system protein ParE